ncbi:helix-turn-helix transcriptional regulator [Bacillus thuringiensis]|nr:helix-turn-helix transcriptional regulator [Bacillus thuringiensis]MED2760156.1 helix-turn-helix transcriptional regulator [Bacillus thuringiensis]MED2771749.1 helix-turn-helix transcriptional regulator [Bacillus thuringiensis]MED2777781.1 helix-turn-helix transcriptional regulator [Bacillus thuringiensis]MED2784299.1 helix-turn-helix transcriptional regulator [Bacillus thuringiensis]
MDNKTYIVKPRLGKILKERKLTQSQLAELANIPQSSISRFDKNEQHRDIHLIAISRALKISIDELFEVKIIK